MPLFYFITWETISWGKKRSEPRVWRENMGVEMKNSSKVRTRAPAKPLSLCLLQRALCRWWGAGRELPQNHQVCLWMLFSLEKCLVYSLLKHFFFFSEHCLNPTPSLGGHGCIERSKGRPRMSFSWLRNEEERKRDNRKSQGLSVLGAIASMIAENLSESQISS